jgi:predicted esterase
MKPDLVGGLATERARAIYDLGGTAIFTSRADPRFQFCLYIPPSIARGARVDLVVAVHGTGRTSFLEFRDGFSEFGRWNDCAILCPIFPVGVCGDGARGGYKYLIENEIRYDLVLLDMVNEVAEKYGQTWDKFALFGFSGGGHFTHRFAILHPEKLWAASIGAPGSVTLLDPDRDWWVGIRNVAELFGRPFDAEALAAVPVHMIVGGADLETWEITHKEGSRHYMPGANDAGETRPDRLRSLKASFEKAGVNVCLEVMPGVSHDRLKALSGVKNFFFDTLQNYRDGNTLR